MMVRGWAWALRAGPGQGRRHVFVLSSVPPPEPAPEQGCDEIIESHGGSFSFHFQLWVNTRAIKFTIYPPTQKGEHVVSHPHSENLMFDVLKIFIYLL